MAVIFYKEGDHAAGFVGFRVATTVGSEKDYRQRYFSLSDYSYKTARKLAYKLNDKWREEAEAYIRDNFLRLNKTNNKTSIVKGLRSVIISERKRRNNKVYESTVPAFAVKEPGYGKTTWYFRTAMHGYEKAFNLAVGKYVEVHGLSDLEYRILFAKLPDITVFTEYLLERTRTRGYNVTKEDILNKLRL